MQLAFITTTDPDDGTNVQLIEALRTDHDYTVIQMRSGRVHFTDTSVKELWEQISEVLSYSG